MREAQDHGTLRPRGRVGVVIVTFNSADVIEQCLLSLLSEENHPLLRIVIVDNCSSDDTLAVIDRVNQRHQGTEPSPVAVIRSPRNGGYAYGVNQGLKHLAEDDGVAGFWVLNPDCVAVAGTPARIQEFVSRASFGLASGRVRYLEKPEIIQTDGGVVSKTTGVCHSVNAGQRADQTRLPPEHELDFLSGSHLIVSRDFLNNVGLMNESYFLYYEEVDWCFRRGQYDLRLIEGAEILHIGGTSIGSGALKRSPSPFSYYVNTRSRMRFVRRFLPQARTTAVAWTVAKAAQVAIRDGLAESRALLAAAFGLSPGKAIQARIPGTED